MSFVSMLFTSVGLGMDAFAVSICKGLSIKNYNINKSVIVGLYFGLFQGIMPLIGYVLGSSFTNIISSFDHYIIFVLLFGIGFNMMREGLSKESINLNDLVNFKEMFPLAIATSIDALAVGITCAFLRVNIIQMIMVISIITFIMTFIGVRIGNVVGIKYEKKAQIIGGIILISLSIKILIEHLFF